MRAGTGTAEFLDRAARHLRPTPPDITEPPANPNGDHVLDREGILLPPGAKLRPAAVLIPVVWHPDEVTVLLTQRTSNLRTHSGQIAFPGGRIDAEDPSPWDTAVREAEEEVGLDRRFVRPLGYLDPYLSATGFMVIPAVGLVEPGFTLTLNPIEVDAAFEVPLGFLMDPSNHELHAREWKGIIREYYAMPFGDRYIWGVTAGILHNLYVRLYEAEP